MTEQEDLIPLERAAERLGVTRATMWRRVREWGLSIYANPVDKRQRLLSWGEIEKARAPRKITDGDGERA